MRELDGGGGAGIGSFIGGSSGSKGLRLPSISEAMLLLRKESDSGGLWSEEVTDGADLTSALIVEVNGNAGAAATDLQSSQAYRCVAQPR